ncbi:hypothetical protein GAY31_29400 [Azospirillum brasilense]|nr:hypothetical protein [Azospirillum brasilense]
MVGYLWPLAKRSAGSVPTSQPNYNERRVGVSLKACYADCPVFFLKVGRLHAYDLPADISRTGQPLGRPTARVDRGLFGPGNGHRYSHSLDGAARP